MSIAHENVHYIFESRNQYNAGDPAPASAYRHLVMTYADVGEEIGRTLGVHCFGVYWVLDRHTNARGTCAVAIDSIAESMSLSRRTVIRSLDVLEENGFITKTKRKGKHGRQLPNTYNLPFHAKKPGAKPSDYPSAPQSPGGQKPSAPQALEVDINNKELPEKNEKSEKPASRLNRISSDYWPTEAQIEQAQQKYGFDRATVDRQTEQFVNHWIAKGERRASWYHSWLTWMGNVKPFSRNGTGAQTKEDKRQTALDYFMHHAQEKS